MLQSSFLDCKTISSNEPETKTSYYVWRFQEPRGEEIGIKLLQGARIKKTRSFLAFKRSREVTKRKLDELIQFPDFRIGL